MAESKPDNRLLAAIAYPIPFVGLFIVFSEMKKDEFMRYHGWQSVFWGAVWLVVYVVVSVVLGIVGGPFPWTSPLYRLLSTLASLVWLGYLILSIWFGYRAYQGEKFTIPFVSEYAQKYGKS